MKKKLCSLLLGLVLLVGLMPATALAAGLDRIDATITTPVVGDTLDTNPVLTTTPEGALDLSTVSTRWIRIKKDKYVPGGRSDWEILKSNVVEDGYYYAIEIECKIASGYFGDSSTVGTINGKAHDYGDLINSRTNSIFLSVTFEPIAKHEHTYSDGDEWEHDDVNHWKVCTYEGCDTKNLQAHDFGEWIVTKKATSVHTGEQYHTCKICSYTETMETELDPNVLEVTRIDATITEPELGKTPDQNPTAVTDPENSTRLLGVSWYRIAEKDYTGTEDDEWESIQDKDYKFEKGYYYSARLWYYPLNNNYVFAEDVTGSLNGKSDEGTITSLREGVVLSMNFAPLTEKKADPAKTTPATPAAKTTVKAAKTGDGMNPLFYAVLAVICAAAVSGSVVISQRRKQR